MSHVLRTRSQMEDWEQFRAGVDSQPQPEHLPGAAQPGALLDELQVWEMQMEEEALVQDVRMPACTREPPRHRGVSKAEDALSRAIRSNPSESRRQDHSDLL